MNNVTKNREIQTKVEIVDFNRDSLISYHVQFFHEPLSFDLNILNLCCISERMDIDV